MASAEGLRELLLDNNRIASVTDVTIECADFTLSRNPLHIPGALAPKWLSAQSVQLGRLGITTAARVGAVRNSHAPGNKLRTLDPSAIAMCRDSLTNLNLSNNQLTELPEQLGDCSNLSELLAGTTSSALCQSRSRSSRR